MDPNIRALAGSSMYRREGNFTAAKRIEEIIAAHGNAVKMSTKPEYPKLSADVSLAMAFDCGISKHRYELIIKSTKSVGKLYVICYTYK